MNQECWYAKKRKMTYIISVCWYMFNFMYQCWHSVWPYGIPPVTHNDMLAGLFSLTALVVVWLCTAKTKYQNFETNIPRKGILGPQSQFPHSCVCERFIHIFPRSVSLFCWRKYVYWSWDYINRSQTYECWNWDWGRAIPRKGIYKWDSPCSVLPFK